MHGHCSFSLQIQTKAEIRKKDLIGRNFHIRVPDAFAVCASAGVVDSFDDDTLGFEVSMDHVSVCELGDGLHDPPG